MSVVYVICRKYIVFICTCPERYRDQTNKILSNLNTTQKKSNVDVNFAIHRTDIGAHCKEITLVSKKRGENKSMLLKKLFEIDTSETSAKQAPQALKEPVESLVQKLENTEQKHLNEIQSMKRKCENTSEEKEKLRRQIKM